PPGAKACPECGSDEQTGWSDEARSSGLGLPDEHFDYDEFVRNEFGREGTVPRGIHWFWWLVGVLVAAAVVVLWFRGH
ncbi:MAG TPA: hypothetical protein VHH88_08110, partial [Verrucomicrobiae bacterium]|nr:hypothetical protein [Verrucomicrobiae bacterium]